MISLLVRRCEWHEGAAAPSTGGATLYFLWLSLLIKCLVAYTRVLGTWVRHGELRDAAGELFIFRKGAEVPALNGSEDAWNGAFATRSAAAVPELLAPLTTAVLVAGKSRRLAQTLTDEEAPISYKDKREVLGLDTEVEERLLSLMHQVMRRSPDVWTSADAADVASDVAASSPTTVTSCITSRVIARRQYPPASLTATWESSASAQHQMAHIELPKWHIPIAPRRSAPSFIGHAPCAMEACMANTWMDDHVALDESALCDELCHLIPPGADHKMIEPPAHSRLQKLMDLLAVGQSVLTEYGTEGHPNERIHAFAILNRLPPLKLMLHEVLIEPLTQACASSGPELLSALPEVIEVAKLLHSVILGGEPRLTARPLERVYMAAEAHTPWRPLVGQLTLSLHEVLVDAGISKDHASRFSFELLPAAPTQPAGSVQLLAGQDVPLDSANVRAFNSLKLTYSPPWPLQLIFSATALAKQQQIFALLLRLRRAKWCLESLHLGRIGSGNGSFGGTLRLWWTLRSELLHAIHHIYGFFSVAVISAEWHAWVARVSKLRDIDSLRTAHEDFCVSVAARCFIEDRFVAELDAIDAILTLALRLRVQLEALSTLPPAAHMAAARRWRKELRRSIQLLTDTLDKQPESRALSEALNFNYFYDG